MDSLVDGVGWINRLLGNWVKLNVGIWGCIVDRSWLAVVFR